MAHRQVPLIKFFEKKGIKTDLFAIEKYVDEILDEVKEDRLEFMAEINRSIGKNEI
jgi:protein involved in ribonucleotide reduction